MRQRALALAAVVLVGMLAACESESGKTLPPEPSASSTDSRTIVTAQDVQAAQVLREGDGYTVEADPPAKIGSRLTYFRGMISQTEAFGTIGEPSQGIGDGGDVVIYDVPSGKIRRLESLDDTAQIGGMTFSDRYVVWSVSSSMGVETGPWTIKSFDRKSGVVRTIATASDVDKEEPSLADPDGGVPRVSGDDAIFVAADVGKGANTASAYRVPLNGSSKATSIAKDVEAAYPMGDRVAVSRKGQFFLLDLATGESVRVGSRPGGRVCVGVAAEGVIVECEETRGEPRLAITEPDGSVTVIDLPEPSGDASTEGPEYFGASADWVTFTYDDKAYVFDLKSKKLGRFPGAQYVSGEQSVGNLICYSRMRTSVLDAKPAPFVKLDIR